MLGPNFVDPWLVEFTEDDGYDVIDSLSTYAVPSKGDVIWLGATPDIKYRVREVEWCIPAKTGTPGVIVHVDRITPGFGD